MASHINWLYIVSSCHFPSLSLAILNSRTIFPHSSLSTALPWTFRSMIWTFRNPLISRFNHTRHTAHCVASYRAACLSGQQVACCSPFSSPSFRRCQILLLTRGAYDYHSTPVRLLIKGDIDVTR